MPPFKVNGKRPERLADPSTVSELPPPGRKPNCASSHPQAGKKTKVEPLAYAGSPAEAIRAVRTLVDATDGADVVYVGEGRYLYATFKSKMFQFVDDFEVLVRTGEESHGDATFLDVRSASRVGYGDNGVNKRRIEGIRSSLAHK